MEIPQETEDYICQMIDHSVGLDVSTDTLLQKLRAVDASNLQFRHQYLYLQSKLVEKDDQIKRAREEASMNALALKKSVEENEKLKIECSNWMARWEDECSLYDADREALMDFANEADQRSKEAEIRICELEEENKKLVDELNIHKQADHLVGVPNEDLHKEQILLDTLLKTMFGKNEVTATARCFLETHKGVEVCQKLLEMSSSLLPTTQKVLALAAELKTLEKYKDYLTINLRRAEDEVNVIFQENKILDEENKMLLRFYRDMHIDGSGGKHTGSASAKGKRKSSPISCISSVVKKLDFDEMDTQRHPLSPLHFSSTKSRVYRK